MIQLQKKILTIKLTIVTLPWAKNVEREYGIINIIK